MPDFDGTVAIQTLHPVQSSADGGFPASALPGGFSAPDTVIPTVVFSPTTGAARTPGQSVVIDVVDVPFGETGGAIRRVVILAIYADGYTELVFNGSAFTSNFLSSSNVAITNGLRFTCTRSGDGWLDNFALHVYAVDTAGNEPAANPTIASYTVASGSGTPVGEGVAPVVTLVSPADGATIDPSTAIVLDVTDNSGELATVTIDVTYQDGLSEAIYDGLAFKPYYRTGSTIVTITGGFRFTLRRAHGGWPAGAPLFNIEPLDPSGNRST